MRQRLIDQDCASNPVIGFESLKLSLGGLDPGEPIRSDVEVSWRQGFLEQCGRARHAPG